MGSHFYLYNKGLHHYKKANLKKVKPNEFGLPRSGLAAVDEGLATGVVDWDGNATNPQIAPGTGYSTTEVTRRINKIWSYRIKTKEQSEMPVILFLLFTLPLWAYSAEPPGQIAVSPSMFELKIGTQPVDESVRLMNLKKTINSIVLRWMKAH